MSVGNSIDPIASVGPARGFLPSTAQGLIQGKSRLFTRAMESAHNDILWDSATLSRARQHSQIKQSSTMPTKRRNRFSTVLELLSKGVLLETLPKQVLERLFGDIAAGPLAAVTAYFGDITPLGNVEDEKSPNGDCVHIDGPAGSIRITYDNRSLREGRVRDRGDSWYEGNGNLIAQRNSAGQIIIASPGQDALPPNPSRTNPLCRLPQTSPQYLKPSDCIPRAA